MNFLCCAAALLGLSGWALANEPALGSVDEVRALSVERASLALPVHLHGVVTFYEPKWNVAFVQDDTGGIFFRLRVAELTPPYPAPGDRIELDGVSDPGLFAPIVEGVNKRSVSFRITGRGPMPRATPLSGAQLSEPLRDCEWVEVRGVIRALDLSPSRPSLELEVDGRHFIAQLGPNTPLERLPHRLVGTPVRVRGVAATVFNQQRQMTGRVLYLPGMECIEAEGAPADDLFAAPLKPFSGLLRAEPGGLQDRVRVRGVVTAPVPGIGMYLRGEGGGLWVQTARPDAAEPGDVVEAVGWPEMAPFKPELRVAIFRVVGREAPPPPVPVTATDALDGKYHTDLICIEGWLAGREQLRDAVRLVLRTEESLFEARVASGPDAAWLAELPAGCLLRVTGICVVTPTPRFKTLQTGKTFEVRLRSAADVALLARPPWWNARRFLWVLGVTLGLALLLLAWILLLRRRVAAQTATIRKQLERETVLEERQRIARELHDTLEQELAGVAMQLDNAARRFDASPEAARAALDSAQRMLRYSRAESRSSIRDLRSITLESRGLAAALDELLRMLAQAAGADFHIEVLGSARRLPATFETHLLRLAHEAVANAARHAAARSIVVSLEYRPDSVELSVTDDGRGFDASADGALPNHFGLLGMQERADQLGGEFLLESSPGVGTRVRVRAPYSPIEPSPCANVSASLS